MKLNKEAKKEKKGRGPRDSRIQLQALFEESGLERFFWVHQGKARYIAISLNKGVRGDGVELPGKEDLEEGPWGCKGENLLYNILVLANYGDCREGINRLGRKNERNILEYESITTICYLYKKTAKASLFFQMKMKCKRPLRL